MSAPPLTFSPGPTKLADHIPALYAQAFADGIGSIGHRSQAYMDVYKFTVSQIIDKLNLPLGYQPYFASAATECWEIVAQSFIAKDSGAFHLHSGSFGRKWADYGKAIRPASTSQAFGINDDPAAALTAAYAGQEIICLTHNETSNATCIGHDTLVAARRLAGPEKLVAVDATSSLGGVSLPWELADIWFASVQKCLAMPAGLAVLIVGPRALQRANQLSDDGHYNSFMAMHAFALKHQNTHTPNVLAITVLGRHLAASPYVAEQEGALKARARRYYAALEFHPTLKPLVTRPESRSDTVIAVQANPTTELDRYKKIAQADGIQLGSGYGPWAAETFRLANFPAYTDEDQQRVLAVLAQ